MIKKLWSAILAVFSLGQLTARAQSPVPVTTPTTSVPIPSILHPMDPALMGAAIVGALVSLIGSSVFMYYLNNKHFTREKRRELLEKRLEKLYSPLYTNIGIISVSVGGYWFSIAEKCEDVLNKKIIPQELKNKTKTGNNPLPKAMGVRIVNGEWVIGDEQKTFCTVKKEEGKLKIYREETMGFKKGSKEKGEPRMKVFLDLLIEQNSHLAGIELQKLLYKMHGLGFRSISEEDKDKMIKLIKSEYNELRYEYFKISTLSPTEKIFKNLKFRYQKLLKS